MKCPRCHSLMTPYRVASPTDYAQRLTNYLCETCFKRVVRVEPNPVMALEYKSKFGSGKACDV